MIKASGSRLVLGLGALFVAALPYGCSSDEGGGSVSQSDAPNAVAVALCGDYYGCSCDENDNTFSSQDDCEFQIAATVQQAIDEGKAAELSYDDTCIPKLKGLVSALNCRASGEIGFDANLIELYQDYVDCKLYYGEKQPGSSCTKLNDSASDDCVKGSKCELGVCSALTARGGVGAPCQQGDECDAGLVCVGIDNPTTKTCQSLPAVGQTCLGTQDLCTTTAYCDQSSKKCVALPGTGQACAPNPNVALRRCAEGNTCEQDTCAAAPGAGETCALECAVGLVCQNNRCVIGQSASCDVTRLTAAGG
ncbi:MAG: hypothetical protein R3B07_12125 [Polyangiaceae bacterium]